MRRRHEDQFALRYLTVRDVAPGESSEGSVSMSLYSVAVEVEM